MKSPEDYCLELGYEQREEILYCKHCKPQSRRKPIKQPFVYAIASIAATQLQAMFLVDVGCGDGYKLSQYQNTYPLIGVDFGPNIQFCKDTYKFGEWYDFDLERDEILRLNRGGGIAICSDVIEHLADPNHIMRTFETWLADGTCKAIVLSTPEKERTYPEKNSGPPENLHHIREWTISELRNYVGKFKLPIVTQGLTADRDNCGSRVHDGSFHSYPNGYGHLPPFRTAFMVLSNWEVTLPADPERWEIL